MKKIGIGCLVVLGVIILLGIIIAVTGRGSKTSTTTTTTENVISTPQEVIKITAKELADAFDENQVAAENNWGGKYVQFSATVSNITDNGISFYNVASKQLSLAQIKCNVIDKQQLLSIKNGQNITVKGTVGKQTIGVIDLSDCEIVQ